MCVAVIQPRVGGNHPCPDWVQRARRGAARGTQAGQQAGHTAQVLRILRRLRWPAILQEP